MSGHGTDHVGMPSSADKHKNLTALFFVLFVPLVLFAAFGLNMRKSGIFTCPPSYAENYYLAYCDGSAYGDFDHGAFWYGLEPEVIENAKAANVMFVGNSRVQFGFSSEAMRAWFAQKGLRPFLLGFTHGENITFTRPLLEKINPGARAYVINVDSFFTGEETPPANDVMRNASTRTRYDGKKTWQFFHEQICTRIGKLCGQTISYYRSRDDGMWRRGFIAENESPARPWQALPLDPDEVARAKAIAPAFIEELNVPAECVILTYIPSTRNNIASARAIAAALGRELVSPVVTGITTFDGSHLDQPSAERFSEAFLEQAGEQLESCAEGRAS